MKKFDISQFYEYTSRYSITETTMVTPIVMGLLKLPSFEGLATLRFIWCGGAPLDAGLQNRLISILHPDAIVSQVWGMTEMGWITTFRYPERDDTGSVGRLLPNMEGK
jgi:long-subunit acyl-CoA synthetase (AMP-forming)